jgi:2-octaprenyl-6-methoxyphenol hydroxylase
MDAHVTTANASDPSEPAFDVAICGAGPVGMALAALLAQRGIKPERIALLDAKTLAQASVDPRSIALSWGSRQTLEEIKAWPIAATPIHQIHVSRRGRFGRSLIDRGEHGVEALGYVTRYGALVTEMAAACARHGVKALRPARVLSCSEDGDGALLTLDAGADQPRTLRAALVVQAEGGLFKDQPGRAVSRDYRQSAIIAQVTSSAPIAHRAFERFTDEGPLALLPQGEQGEYSLVWCVRPGTASNLLALSDDAFLAQLGAAFGARLGHFTQVGPRQAYPLGLSVDGPGSARSVAIGNAAQTLHPVAGQGLNLGLRDAAVLARVLARGAGTQPGTALLQQFRTLRQVDRAQTVRMTDALARIFTGDAPTQTLLGAALNLVDMTPPARHLLAELMMFGRR